MITIPDITECVQLLYRLEMIQFDYVCVRKYVICFSLLHVQETTAVCAVCPSVNRQQDRSMWVILSESQDNRKKAFSDRWVTGVREWEKVKMGETQSLPH